MEDGKSEIMRKHFHIPQLRLVCGLVWVKCGLYSFLGFEEQRRKSYSENTFFGFELLFGSSDFVFMNGY